MGEGGIKKRHALCECCHGRLTRLQHEGGEKNYVSNPFLQISSTQIRVLARRRRCAAKETAKKRKQDKAFCARERTSHLRSFRTPVASLYTPNDVTDTLCEMFCRTAFISPDEPRPNPAPFVAAFSSRMLQ
ncbi:hypothetical protein CDAR_98491 [Caerostris darwini]|uniref:Uncharacterized protein n=1 Tax=Caerostris darwini TaxID=1538125 RepID=A0AAV4UFW5_9ARAC|nr:hypothetical protein CDAR_98491 [Caerostris darwini]